MRKAMEAAAADAAMTRLERAKAIEEVKKSVREVKVETEVAVIEVKAENIATPLTPGQPLEEGTMVVVLEQGNLFGLRGYVSQRNKGRGRVVVRIGGIEVKMERHLIGIPLRAGPLGFPLRAVPDGNGTDVLSAKEKRLLKMLEEDLVDPDKMLKDKAKAAKGKLRGLRTSVNTIDVRALKTWPEIQQQIVRFIEKMVDSGDEIGVMYVHHGNGKGSAGSGDAFKAKLRTWLKQEAPLVRRAVPAELSDGGDAFTVVELSLED